MLAAVRRYIGTDNYAAIYKRQRPDSSIVKMPKPELTPIATNRDASSAFLLEIQSTTPEPIEPVFVDFSRDLTRLSAKQDIEVLYTFNPSNDLFTLTYIYEKGSGHDIALDYVSDLLSLSGTSDMTPEQISRAFYDLACSYRVNSNPRRTYITLSGLSENMEAAMALYEKLLDEATVSPEAYSAWVDRLQQSRDNNKTNQSANFSRLSNYAVYGPHNPANTLISTDSLRTIGAEPLLNSLRSLRDLKHRIIYYGKAPRKASSQPSTTCTAQRPYSPTLPPANRSDSSSHPKPSYTSRHTTRNSYT